MSYYTLLRLEEMSDGTLQWGIEFGDHELQTVEDERDEYLDRDDVDGEDDLKIITTLTEEQAEIDAAVAELNKTVPKIYTFEVSDYIPRGVHINVTAPDYATALAKATDRVEQDDIEWSDQKTWDDGCTSSRITGAWLGSEAYSGADIRTKDEVAAYERELATEVAPTVVANAADTIRAKVKAYNDNLNAHEIVPTADDYNALLAIIGG